MSPGSGCAHSGVFKYISVHLTRQQNTNKAARATSFSSVAQALSRAMENAAATPESPSGNNRRQRKTAVVCLFQELEVRDTHPDVPYADSEERSATDSDEEADQVRDVARHAPEPGALTAKFRRRNSISLPAGLDALAVVPEGPDEDDGSDDGSSRQGSCSDDEASYSNSDDDSVKVPLRNPRKKSIMPLPKLRLNNKALPDDEFEERGFSSGMDSPANSVTSINSLSSLLKEKLVMTFPGVLRRKRPREYKLKVFVAILFLCIVFLIGFAYIFYHQQVLQRAYFERIRFNKDVRQIKVYSADGNELVSGDLGVHLKGSSYPCLGKDNPGNGSVCLEWMRYARLVMKYNAYDNDVRCYHIAWQSLSNSHDPTDCFDWGHDKGHWFGGGLAAGGAWPLEAGYVRMAPFVTGNLPEQAWANVLQRYFLSSKGVAIIVDDDSPLYVSINSTEPHRFCIRAKHDDFAYVYHTTDLPLLNYSICTAPDVKQLHEFLAENSLWDGIKDTDLQVITSMLVEPVWEISANNRNQMTEVEVTNLTEEVISLGYPAGQVLLNELWQTSIGDLTLDESRFPTFKDTVDIIHRRGFRVTLTVLPFVSTESASFYEAVRDELLVNERGGKIPALTRFKNILSAGVLDITRNHTILWVQQKLKALQQQFGVDSFYLNMGSAHDIPKYYQFERQLTNPDQFKTLFTQRILQSVPLMGVSGAIQRPQPPTFVSLPSLPSDWRSMQKIIPSALTYGLVGFPFLLSAPVGGDCEIVSKLPDRELYIRWMQLNTFMPTMVFRHLPSRYDPEVEKIAKGLLDLRQSLVNPLLTKAVDDALNHGVPFIRPLWMLEPLDQAAQSVDDEFSVNDQLIVAPVLHPNSLEREIYLPSGVWKDGIDGSMRKGNRWIHHYQVPLDKVAYFVRLPNNTRF